MNDLFIIRVEADMYEDFTDQELVIIGKEKAEKIYRDYVASRSYIDYDNDCDNIRYIYRVRLYSAKVDADGIVKPDKPLFCWKDCNAKWLSDDDDMEEKPFEDISTARLDLYVIEGQYNDPAKTSQRTDLLYIS